MEKRALLFIVIIGEKKCGRGSKKRHQKRIYKIMKFWALKNDFQKLAQYF